MSIAMADMQTEQETFLMIIHKWLDSKDEADGLNVVDFLTDNTTTEELYILCFTEVTLLKQILRGLSQTDKLDEQKVEKDVTELVCQEMKKRSQRDIQNHYRQLLINSKSDMIIDARKSFMLVNTMVYRIEKPEDHDITREVADRSKYIFVTPEGGYYIDAPLVDDLGIKTMRAVIKQQKELLAAIAS